MSRQPGCPRCAAPVAATGDQGWSCPEHGLVPPLWRPGSVTYDDFVEHLYTASAFPTLLPWPMSPGWTVSDFASAGERGAGQATLTCTSGTSELDGPVDVLVVTEEPGIGLGARVAGTEAPEAPGRVRGARVAGTEAYDPGRAVQGPPAVHVRVDRHPVPMWPVSTSAREGGWDRSVVAGEYDGRWLWLVLRPASAILLLRDDWILRDVSGFGPPLVELPFGGPAPPW